MKLKFCCFCFDGSSLTEQQNFTDKTFFFLFRLTWWTSTSIAEIRFVVEFRLRLLYYLLQPVQWRRHRVVASSSSLLLVVNKSVKTVKTTTIVVKNGGLPDLPEFSLFRFRAALSLCVCVCACAKLFNFKLLKFLRFGC